MGATCAASASYASGQLRHPGDALTVEFAERPLAAVTVLTEPATGTRAEVGIRVPGEGWRRLGALSGDGWTELAADGARADAVRLSWGADSAAPVVHEVVPWSAAGPDMRLELPRDEADVVIGGAPVTLDAEVAARRPGDVHGRLTGRAPEGLKATFPGRVEIPRGATARTPIEIRAGKDVEPGVYEIPVRLADGRGGDAQRRTVTVRAFPPAGGPDLARAGVASSSADETAGFPARAVNDGDPATRWSSPAEDGAWVQVRLAERARVGEVTLHWERAYAARYRVQVSPDGRRWRTAATVDDGGGGRETVRMDERDVRYVRVQGVERATRFGYSLWSLEVRAVRG